MQILAGIILLGVLIVFHELGHFLFAKWLGVRVLVFSVGFGPKIWGFKRGETEYRLSAIPLGGYVRMFGESLEEELSLEEKNISFMHQPIWRKSLIAVAGPLFNFILPVILFFFLLVGVEHVFAPKVGTLIKGGVAEQSGIKVDDLIVSVDGKPVTSFNEVADMVAKKPNVDVNLGIRRSVAGSFTDLFITVRPEGKSSKNPLEGNIAVGRIGIMPSIELPIVVVNEHSPLKALGLESFDEITEINGNAIYSASSLSIALANLGANQTIKFKRKDRQTGKLDEISIQSPQDLSFNIIERPITTVHNLPDRNFSQAVQKTMEMTETLLKDEVGSQAKSFGIVPANGAIDVIEKGSVADKLNLSLEDRIISVDGERLLTSIQLQQALIHDATSPHVLGVIKKDGAPQVVLVSLPKDEIEKMNLNTDLLSLFGISTVQVFKSGETFERKVGVFEAFTRAAEQTVDIAWMTAKSLWLLVKMEVPASQIGGPIMLFDVAQQAAHKGLPYYIFIMCLLSVNLGLLNLLPIPALDGGHLLLFGIEAVQQKPLTSRTRTIATQIGVAILLMIMAVAIFNDLSRLFR